MRAFFIVTSGTPCEIMTMTFDELPEFQKERKRLARKYRSLSDDLREFRNVVSVVPLGNRKHFTVIAQNENLHIVKARLFCRYLKGSSLRVIYSYFEQEQRIEFIEIYFKGDKENEDRHRVKEYLTKYQD
jgi:hypothetical protein